MDKKIFFIIAVVVLVFFVFFNGGAKNSFEIGHACKCNEDCGSENCNFDGKSNVCCPKGEDCCINDLGCPSKKICNMSMNADTRVCIDRVANGGSCKTNLDCHYENCVNGICCFIGETCCKSDEDCDGVGRCDSNNHYCRPLQALGQECTHNYECLNENCVNGVCCAEGKICCASDLECPFGKKCSNFYEYCA
ncbi:MAG: hypothetical protein AABX66_01210 [Nanoarchaeota archaeon]